MTKIRYVFELKDKIREYELSFDDDWGLQQRNGESPGWTKLDHNPCEGCPLLKLSPMPLQCPLALGISDIIETFKDDLSYDSATIRVITDVREFKKVTNVQVGLQSLMGLVMPTSGCPRMAFLKPMARFHLPFSSFEETVVRSLSFFLMRQMCKTDQTLSDFSLSSFLKSYEDVSLVNQGLLERIRNIGQSGDADQNAIVILDSFAQMLVMNLSKDISFIEKYFSNGKTTP